MLKNDTLQKKMIFWGNYKKVKHFYIFLKSDFLKSVVKNWRHAHGDFFVKANVSDFVISLKRK